MDTKTTARILVVDDNSKNLQLVGSLLSQEGYDVAFSLSGEHALKTVSDIQPDLILLDIMMPGIDGYQVCKAVRKIKTLESVPVLFLTAKTRTEDVVAGFKLGAVDYILKPFNSKELLARVKTHVKLKKAQEKIVKLNAALNRRNDDLVVINRTMDTLVREKTSELNIANRKLKTLNDEKMDFIRFLTHELNTPLNFIAAMQTIDQEQLNEDTQMVLDLVDQGFTRINRFLTAVIGYFDFAADMAEPEPDCVKLNPVIQNAVSEISSAARDKAVELHLNGTKNSIVQADKMYLAQLISILIENAVAFSNTGQTVDIDARLDNGIPVITIKDNGKGIPKKNLELIFKPFLIPEFERMESGFALSLPKAKIIADTCGWKLSVKSDGQDKGACFKLELEGCE